MSVEAKLFFLMWYWWAARKKVNAGERKKSAQQIISDVLLHLQAWRDAGSVRVYVRGCSSFYSPWVPDTYTSQG